MMSETTRSTGFRPKLQCLFASGCHFDVEISRQQVGHQHPQFLVVIHDQNRIHPPVSGNRLVRPHGRQLRRSRHQIRRIGPWHRFVDLFPGVGVPAYGQYDPETISLPFAARNPDMPLVDIGQILHQRQPDTRTDGMELTVITVVEALEKPVDSLLAHAFTAIGDHYTDKTGAFHPHTDFYFPFVGCVFGSVGKQVVDDLIEFVGIEPAFDTVGRTLEVDPKALFDTSGANASTHLRTNAATSPCETRIFRLPLSTLRNSSICWMRRIRRVALTEITL